MSTAFIHFCHFQKPDRDRFPDCAERRRTKIYFLAEKNPIPYLFIPHFFFSNVLRNLATIQSDINLHADAVLRGRLSAKNREDISLAQTRHLRWLHDRQKARGLAAGGKGRPQGHDVDLDSGVYPELEKAARRRSLWSALKDIQLAMFRYVRAYVTNFRPRTVSRFGGQN